jgi:hypothetical protein
VQVRDCVPPPHVAEHALQLDQPPLTGTGVGVPQQEKTMSYLMLQLARTPWHWMVTSMYWSVELPAVDPMSKHVTCPVLVYEAVCAALL